ncbi:DGQHR domain-containing protein [Azospirillum tabaci]|uniref:DGQHR domain-containing protein n=1 Tax=Azospirillum tabaci TaxID=2752310 RepID=UPI0016606A9E|nr:DNA sulfur modification protein DndB [Azospirillum tabaci]
MAILIPAIKAKLGNTEYFETTMKVRDLVQAVRPPKEMDRWANLGIEERMQRDADLKRIKNQLAPYIVRNADRFFGSLIVLVYNGKVEFETMAELAKSVPAAYKQIAQQIGFLTIDGGALIVLDGQHRLLALRLVQQGDAEGDFAAEVPDDEVCVLFINYENDVKTRRIFNTVNRYAKQTSRGDNIITSEDDGYAIVARRLLRDGAPLGSRVYGKKSEDVVEWKNNTLTTRSTRLTTISVVYETVKLVLAHDKVAKLDPQDRPDDDALDTYTEHVTKLWETLLEHIEPYQTALTDLSRIPEMRKDEAMTALLFKPAAQLALVDGVLRSMALGKLTLVDAVKRVNRIPDWSMGAELWRDIIIKSGGTIDAGGEARERMATLICYLIAADKLDEKIKAAAWRSFTSARGKPDEDLPKPVEGEIYTASEAKKFLGEATAKAA